MVEDVITEVLLACDQDHQDNESVVSSELDDDETASATKKRKEGVLSRLMGDEITIKTTT